MTTRADALTTKADGTDTTGDRRLPTRLLLMAAYEIEALCAVLERYMAAYPAFRIKPEGAPGSLKRIEQERLMALEDAARAALSLARGEKQ